MKKGTRVLWHEFVGTVATKPYEMDGYPGVKFVDLDVSHQQTRGADNSVTPTTGTVIGAPVSELVAPEEWPPGADE
jgi:hypothetical protein